MAWQSTPWADPLLVSTVVAATLAVFGLLYVLLVRHDRRVTAFAAVMIGTAVWTLGYSFQFASADIAGKRLWAMVSMAGEAVVPAAWCTFALVYARRGEWLTRPRLAALWTVPALTVVLAATNGRHGLVRRETATALAPDGGYVVLAATPGPWMAVHGAYSYLVAFVEVVLVVGLIGRTRRVYRGQAAVLLAGILVPAAANLASLADYGPGATVDLTPPSMAVLGVAIDEGAGQRYIDLTVSRVEAGRVTGRLVVVRDVTDRIRLERRFRRLIEASSDIVFVLNEGGDIEYASPSVERVLGYDPGALVGRLSFEDLIVEDGGEARSWRCSGRSLRSVRSGSSPPRAGAPWRGTSPSSSR